MKPLSPLDRLILTLVVGLPILTSRWVCGHGWR